VARADAARDGGRGRVGEEDAQPDERDEERRGQRQARELGGAEMADDRAVHEDEQRLGDERSEGGDGEGEDLAVEPGTGAALRVRWRLRRSGRRCG
jgi:hypothetical protein